MPASFDDALDAHDEVKLAARRRKTAEEFATLSHALQNGHDAAGVADLAGKARVALDQLQAQAAPAPLLDITPSDDGGFRFTHHRLGLTVSVDAIRETHDGIKAEVCVVSTDRGRLHWGEFNLASTSSRTTLAKKLGDAHCGAPWPNILEGVCYETAMRFRAGEPSVELVPSEAPFRYAVDKVLVLDEINEWYGDGGQLKSFGALALALTVAHGIPLPCGLTPRIQGPCLYLDYETNRATFERRLGALMRGIGIPLTKPSGVFYRSPNRPLMNDLSAIRREIAQRNAVLVIVDSFMFSIGGMSLLDAANPTMNALRSLPGTKLLHNHVAKAQADQRGPTRALGTVTMMNGPRNAWELKGGEDEGNARTVGFYHTKANDTRKHKPFALRYEFTETASGILTVTVRAADLADVPELAARINLSDRLLQVLRRGAQTVEDLVEATEASGSEIRARLSTLKKKGKVTQLDQRRGRQNVWGLRHE